VVITPILLSGGGGTRLWPMSTPQRPKQFLALTGAQTMFQMTLNRVSDRSRFAAPMIVAGINHIKHIDAQLAELGIDDARQMLEPCARNTAPAIALAALACAPDAVLLVMPSDHVIADNSAFQAAIDVAAPLANQGWMITFGITPTGPETGYGYIQSGPAIATGVHTVQRFVEKPDATRAAAMIAAGDHAWNGGIFLFRADAYLAALAQFAPEMLAACQHAIDGATYQASQIHPAPAAFAAAPSDSIDYAVMEKSDKVAVVPVDMGWSDIGSWDALSDFNTSSEDARILEIDTTNNLIRTNGICINIVGASDLIVVASGNDLLIIPRGQSQEVKRVVEALKARGG
jgi:mannose-1-phosphate guanylyltransferase